MGPTSGPAGGASDRQRPGDAGKGPGWGGQICSRGVSKPSHGSYPCLEGTDSVTSRVDVGSESWRARGLAPVGMSTAIQKGLVAEPARGGQVMGGISTGAQFPPEPMVLPEGPCGQWASTGRPHRRLRSQPDELTLRGGRWLTSECFPAGTVI